MSHLLSRRGITVAAIAPTLALLASGAIAQSPEGAKGPAEPTLEMRIQRLCEDVDQRRQDLHISGLSLAVVKEDRVILARGFGLRDREKKIPADERTLYGVGSTTKAFTTMLCAMLADEGKLSFADRPAKFLPWFHFKDPAADANATLRDLLCHRTGLTRNDVAWVGTEATREQLLRSVAEIEPQQPFFERGADGKSGKGAWQYNNCMFLCAGECAAAIEKKSWDELIAARIFAPLGMKQSTTTDAAALADPMLSGRYDWDAAKNDFETVNWMKLGNMAPAGSICSTVVDMAQWVRFLLRRGQYEGRRLVADAQFEELWRDDDKLEPSYGLGWFLHADDPLAWAGPDGKKHLVIEHGGNVGGYSAAVGMLPDLDVGLVLLTNTSATQLQQGILPLVFDAIAGPWKERRAVVEGKSLAEEETKSWLGPWSEGRAAVPNRVLARTGDHLVLVFPRTAGQNADAFFTLIWPGDDGRAWFKEEPESYATFSRDDKGSLVSLTVVRRDVKRVLTRVAAPAESAPPDMSVEEMLAKRNDATGFEKAAGFRSLRLTGTLRFPQAAVKGRYVVTARGFDAVRVDFDASPFGHARTIVAGGRGTFDAHMGSMPELPAARAALLAFANPILECGNWLDAAEDVTIARLTNVSPIGMPLPELCYVVEVKPVGADALSYFVAANDHRLVGVFGPTAFPGVPSQIPLAILSDVREVEGVKLAFHREMMLPDIGRMVVQFDKAEVDVDLPPDFFALPPPTAPKEATKGAGS
jgi:CubicO group peptidase (beta-lactamase class C family)